MVNKAILSWAGIAVIWISLLTACNQGWQPAATPLATYAAPLPEATSTSSPSPQPTPTITEIPPSALPVSSETPLAGHETALVVRVLDGDTVEVLLAGEKLRLRYIGIDSPEDGLPFSSEATQANRQLVEGKKVLLEKDVSETDRYDRLLRYVYLQDGTFINAELVRAGYARAAAYPPDTRYQDYLESVQQEASQAGLGIWALPLYTNTPSIREASPSPAAEQRASELAALVVIDPGCSQFNAPGDDNANKNEEYICLTNQGVAPAEMEAWWLHDEYGWRYTFTAFSLAAGASVRIRSGCGSDSIEDLYWCRDETAIWNNGGDCATLLDSQGVIVHQYCYKD
jgi:endonuclease YncB( thermonuclease family)